MALFPTRDRSSEKRVKLVRSVPAAKTDAEIMKREMGDRFDSVFGLESLPPGWNPDYLETERSNIFRLGLHGEAAFHAWYQSVVAPWMTTPAGLAIANTMGNAVAKLPLRMINKKTGEVKDELPEYYRYPLGRIYNPSFRLRELLKMGTLNLYRFGTSHILARYKDRVNTDMLRPLDSLTVKTDGPMTRPTWSLRGTTSNWTAGRTRVQDPDLPKNAKTIYPDGRMLEKKNGESSQWGMLLVTMNQSPGSNNGVPPGLLNYPGTLSAIGAQDHAANFFRDGTWQHLFITPDAGLRDLSNLQQSNEEVAKSLSGTHRATVAPLPYDVKSVGFSARDSQLVETREADMGIMAIAHNMPASHFSTRGTSYAQIYADHIRLTESGVLPLACDFEEELSRALTLEEQDEGWCVEFDRSAIKDGDPQTIAKIAEIVSKAGLETIDEAREKIGRQPLGDDWSGEAYMDGNRRPASSLADIAEAQITKSQSTGRPADNNPAETPRQPRPSDE